MKGPETVIFDNHGVMYIMNEEGFLIRFGEQEEDSETTSVTARAEIVTDLGMGRPLGGAFDANNHLYMADAHLGLTRLKNPGSGSKVELIASRVQMENGEWSQILYANDVAIGPKTGHVYFTDSTEIAPDRIGTRSWDTMFAAKMDLIRGSKSGRLLKYDPSTDTVSVLASGFHFPNGVAVDKDEQYVLFGETYTFRLQRYNLKTGQVETVVDGPLTGFPDGLDCAWKGISSVESEKCYAVLISSITPLLVLIRKIPHPFDRIVRSLVLALPKSLAPPTEKYGGIVEYDPSSGTVELLQDPDGSDIGMLTGVTVHDNKLFLGSLTNDYIGLYNL